MSMNFLKTPVEPSKITVSTSLVLLIVAGLTFLIDHDSYVDLGHYLLGLSIIIIIAGIAISFSKKEREHARERAVADLPEQVELINTPDADKKTQRRGYYLLVFGIVLFLIWSWFFGFSSLSTIDDHKQSNVSGVVLNSTWKIFSQKTRKSYTL